LWTFGWKSFNTFPPPLLPNTDGKKEMMTNNHFHFHFHFHHHTKEKEKEKEKENEPPLW
jgi:hypothetical protein